MRTAIPKLTALFVLTVSLAAPSATLAAQQAPQSSSETDGVARAAALVAEALKLDDPQQSAAKLAKARAVLEQLLAAKPTRPKLARANVMLGTVLLEIARTELARAGLSTTASEREKLIAGARRNFASAQEFLELAQMQFDDLVKSFPTGPLVGKADQERNVARAQLIKARFQIARNHEESAAAYERDDPSRRARLTKAAKSYGEIYEKHRRWVAALYARTFEARCLWNLGGKENTLQALAYWEELLEQAAQIPALRPLESRTLPLAMRAWNSETQKQYQESLKRAAAWIDAATAAESESTEGLAIRWQAVVAVDRLLEEDKTLGAKEKQRLLKQASDYARFVADHRGDHQQQARKWLDGFVLEH